MENMDHRGKETPPHRPLKLLLASEHSLSSSAGLPSK